MAVPSSKYAVDSTTTLNNGTILNWTKSIASLYPSANTPFDLSCCFTEWGNMPNGLKTAGYGFKWNNMTDVSAPAYGQNAGGTRWAWGATRSGNWRERCWMGVVLTNKAGASRPRRYFFGYSDSSSSVINTGSAGNYKILRDMQNSKMLFSVSITATRIDDWDSIDYVTNPTSPQTPSNVTITLKELEANPADYLVSAVDIEPAMVYGETSAGAQGHWLSSSITPMIMANGDTTGGFIDWPFLSITPTGNYTSTTSSGKFTFTGGTGNSVPYSLSTAGTYIQGLDFDSFAFTLPNTYADIETKLLADGRAQWGDTSTWSHPVYFELDRFAIGEGYAYVQKYGTANNNYNPNTHVITGNVSAIAGGVTVGLSGGIVSRWLASLGLYFYADGTYDPDTDNLTPDTLYQKDDIWLGKMSDNGTTTGEWIKGNDIRDYAGPNKNGDINNPTYTPGSGGGGPSTDEDNDDPIPTVGVPFASGLAHYYVTTAASTVLEQISEAMSGWDIDTSKKDLYRNLISCKLIKPPAPIPSTPGLTFTIYGVQPEYQGSPITITGVAGNPTASFGPYSIDRKFNDFRDYAPYTKCEIFLPYCGWCGLPSHVVGRSVSVYYYTDIIAATCKAVVYCGSNIVAEASGVIGVDIPFASENVGAKMEAANAGLVASTKGALQTAIGVGTLVTTKGQKGVNTLASGLSTYISGFTQMSMAANENWTEINGQTGDGCNLAGSSAIVIKITRPKFGSSATAPYVPDGYAHNIGYTSMKGVTVGSVSGLLIADNVDTSNISGATERERAEIKRLLETGIIV